MSDRSKDTSKKRGVAVKERTHTKRPKMYRVLFHNDDYTTMDFVVLVLRQFFDLDRTEATRVMLMVHHSGSGVAGCYAYEVAETKIHQASEFSRAHDFPLRITMEPD